MATKMSSSTTIANPTSCLVSALVRADLPLLYEVSPAEFSTPRKSTLSNVQSLSHVSTLPKVCSFHPLLQNSVSSALSIPLTVWLHGTRRDGTLSPYSLWLLSALPMALSCVRPQSEGHRLLAPARAAWLPHRPRPRWTLVSSRPPAPRQLLPSPRRADFGPGGPFGRP